MRIALLVPDGIGIRNYLFSDLLEHLKEHELHLVHHLPAAVLQEVLDLHPMPIKTSLMPEMVEDRMDSTLRKICMYGRFHLHARIARNASIKKNWVFFSIVKGRQKLLYRMIDFLGAIVSIFPAVLNATENLLYKRMMRTTAGKNALRHITEIKPDVILCTHQRSVEAGYLMTAARQLGIATVTVMFSWDNLPKSRINFKADRYLVWSQWMKNDLLRFYRYIKEEQVVITGTPQFEFYKNPALVWGRDQFSRYFHLPENRPLVCFSGNEPSFPSDHLYLKDLLEELQLMEGDQLPFIIVRPSPVDHTNRFADIVSQYSNLAILARPEWNLHGARGWESFYPAFSDTIVLTNLVHHCEAVINVGSTMGLDFAHTNKPALYIRYNHPDCRWFNLKYGYQQEHFKSLKGLDAVVWIDDKASFAPKLIEVLNHPENNAPDRLKWKALITGEIPNPTSRIAKSLIFTP